MNGKNSGPKDLKLTTTENYYTENNILRFTFFYHEVQQFYSVKKLFFYSAIGKTNL